VDRIGKVVIKKGDLIIMAEQVYLTHLTDLLNKQNLEANELKQGILSSYRLTNRLLRKKGIEVFSESAADDAMDKSVEIIFRTYLEKLGTTLEVASKDQLLQAIKETNQELKYENIDEEAVEDHAEIIGVLMDKTIHSY